MKRNIIMIVVDAFYYGYIGENNFKKSSTPFLDKLIKNNNCLSVEKMYSEAPYTEAALMSLLGGCDTLDNGSYMKRLKNTDCVLKEYQKSGYRVFANCYQSSIYPSGALTGVNDIYYNSSFNLKSCWDYRISYYADLYKKNNLNKNSIKLIEDILNDNFLEAIEFLNCIKTNNKKIEILSSRVDYKSAVKDLNCVKKEYSEFKKDTEKYIYNLLENPKSSIVTLLESYSKKGKIEDENLLNEIEKRYKNIVKKIYYKNLYYNLKNNRISLKRIINLINNKQASQIKNYIKNYISAIFDRDLVPRVQAKTYNEIKSISSAKKQFDHFKKWYLEELNQNENYFAYLHIDDIHFREMFFTHDTKDLNVLDKEFEEVKKYIKKIPKNYKGSLAYDLSVQYVDKQLEELFDFFQKNDILKNTDIIITADHGNSYTYNNIRENYVINFYDENYHVPCIIYSEKHKFNINQQNFYQTKDIPVTLLEMNNIKIPNSYTGTSLINFSGRDHFISEYIGSGCPDIINRPVMIKAETKNYSVVMEGYLSDEKTFKIIEIYDMKKDKNQNINIIKDIKDKDIEYELEIIKKEIKKLKETNKHILKERQ